MVTTVKYRVVYRTFNNKFVPGTHFRILQSIWSNKCPIGNVVYNSLFISVYLSICDLTTKNLIKFKIKIILLIVLEVIRYPLGFILYQLSDMSTTIVKK